MIIQKQIISKLPDSLWRNDSSLRRAGQLLDLLGGKVRAVSFDFFDTLVWRLTGKPSDVFHEVGLRLTEQGRLPKHILAADFEVYRRIGESKARMQQSLKDKVCEDVKLNAIYEQLQMISVESGAFAEAEIAAEGDLCMLNPVMLQFAQNAKQRGLRVFIISDIYLSAEDLRTILRKNRFDPEFFDQILTSSEAGVCKWTGNLFREALKIADLKGEQMLHIGDNFQADVVGARKFGVRGVHYRQHNPDTRTILDREKVLLGGSLTPFSVSSLRLLAARNFSGESPQAFFGREGAMLMGPLLSRYATWACQQFVAMGVRKVGAFMREGELLGQILQREADAMGYALEIKPLYVNRKSTEVAAIGNLTAENLIDWLERRQTLPVKTIVAQFGLLAEDIPYFPFSLEEKINTPELIIKFAKFLFTPEIVQRIEARSTEERRKVMDYLHPWLDGSGLLGLIDLGYNASAQMQLKKILDLERDKTKLVGCFLITCERAALRVLDGLDVRHFLGAFGNPTATNYAFLRSPAFIEQSIVAGCGTTIGYARQSDGSVKPLLDENRFSPDLMKRQNAFKDGVLFYQQLWLHLRSMKPEVLDGSTNFSRRVLDGSDQSNALILARATAFPLRSELAYFGSIPLDDYYFVDGVKTICGPVEREILRTKGFAKTLTEQGVLWPQAVHHIENPRVCSDFFAFAKAMLLCNPEGDGDSSQCDLTIIVSAGGDPTALRECLSSLKASANKSIRHEIIILTTMDEKVTQTVVAEFNRDLSRLRISKREEGQSLAKQLNFEADSSSANYVLILDDGVRLAPAWDTISIGLMESDEATVALVQESESAEQAARCVLIRRTAIAEALGFAEHLGQLGGTLHLLLSLRSLKLNVIAQGNLVACLKSIVHLEYPERTFIKRCWADFDISVNFLASKHPAIAASDLNESIDSDRAALTTVDCNGDDPKFGNQIIEGRKGVGLGIRWREFVGSTDELSWDSKELSFALALRHLNIFHGSIIGGGADQLVDRLSPADGFNGSRMLAMSAKVSGGISISHGPGSFLVRTPDADYSIGRTMSETDRIPLDWGAACNRMDEVWVPSQFNVETFAASGVERSKLVVMPGSVDSEFFDPARHPDYPLPNKARFNFLAIFEWSSRKGWDVLLAAYLREFSAADDVCLWLRTYLFSKPDGDPSEAIRQRIQEFTALLGLDGKNLPRIELIAEQVPSDQLPGLYLACDCYLAPSRGEGWGRPQHEAMLMERPVIATNWSGNTEFMTPDNSYLLDYEVVDTQGLEPELSHYKGHRWANPSEIHLRTLMRHVFTHPEEARIKGQAARKHMARHYNREAVADRVIHRLQHIERSLKQYGLAPAPVTQIHASTSVRDDSLTTLAIDGSFLDLGSLSSVNRALLQALDAEPSIRAGGVCRTVAPVGVALPPEVQCITRRVFRNAPLTTEITVRHEWPPRWDKPQRGAWVLIQPWEFGSIPAEWAAQAQNVDEIWCPSRYVRSLYLQAGIPTEKLKVLPNGYNPLVHHPNAAPTPIATRKRFKFLFVGGTIARKGADLLLATFLKTFSRSDDVCLVIKDFGGQSAYQGQTLAERIRSAQADTASPEIVYLDQELPEQELAGLYTACDCLVHPYRGEGFGLPVLEAMACALPVICTGGGATDDFATDEFVHRLPSRRAFIGNSISGMKLDHRGWWLEPDLEELSRVMREMVLDPRPFKERAKLGAQHVLGNWTWAHSARTMAVLASDLKRRLATAG